MRVGKLYDLLDIGVIVVDQNSTIVLFNRWSELKSGRNRNDVQEKNLYEVFPDIQERGLHIYLQTAFENMQPQILSPQLHKYFLAFPNADGRPQKQSVQIIPFFENGNKGLVIILKDMSAALIAENAISQAFKDREERYHMLIQTASDAIVTVNAAGHITDWNRAAEKMFGFTEAEICGQPVTLLVPQKYSSQLLDRFALIQAGGESRLIGSVVEMEGQRKDGSEFPLELSLAQWETSTGRFYTGFVRDITELKKATEERERLIRELQGALAKVKQLSGMLPICACCKKIRDDKGVWTQMESYVHTHSEAEFSHGLCPDCYKIEIIKIEDLKSQRNK